MKKATKGWFSLDFESDPAPAKLKCTKNMAKRINTALQPQLHPVSRRSFDFCAQLEPKEISHLAVHPKKIKEVECWLDHNVINDSLKQATPFLLITGPSGTGKTATVKVLCHSKKLSISEWTNPVDQDFELTRGLSQVGRFQEFLSESRWRSLFASHDNKLVLVEEFPNAVVRNPEEFWMVLEECYYKAGYPVVFICTDSLISGGSHQNLFSQEVKDRFNVAHISFNACAVTLLRSALKRAHEVVQQNLDIFKTPSHTTVDAIIATSMGDIRCAINQYYFASLLESGDLPIVHDKYQKKKTGTKRKRNDTKSTIPAMSRDENLGLFHSLGRVLNPKRIDHKNTWTFSCSIEKLVDEFITQPGIFTAFLFENYIKYFGALDDACKAAEILSLSQIFLEKWINREDTLVYALWVAVMGLMIHNEHKVSKWNQIRGPTKVKPQVKQGTADLCLRNMGAADLFYYKIIRNKKDAAVYDTKS